MGSFLRILRGAMLLMLTHLYAPVVAQDSEPVSNSLADHYRSTVPGLKYSYANDTRTHDYSGNWDLDSDGITDRVCFIGTGGAHLYYFLHIALSSDNSAQDLRFIETDTPVLLPTDSLLLGNARFGFSVVTDKDSGPRIVVQLNSSTVAAHRSRLKRLKAHSGKVAIRFAKGKARIEGS